jgi:hypothetical protein
LEKSAEAIIGTLANSIYSKSVLGCFDGAAKDLEIKI